MYGIPLDVLGYFIFISSEGWRGLKGFFSSYFGQVIYWKPMSAFEDIELDLLETKIRAPTPFQPTDHLS